MIKKNNTIHTFYSRKKNIHNILCSRKHKNETFAENYQHQKFVYDYTTIQYRY